MFAQRAIISLTLGPLALYLVYLGGWFYFVPLLFILLVAVHEYNYILQNMNLHTSVWVMGIAVLLLLVSAQFLSLTWFGLALLVGMFLVLAYALWLYERDLSATAVVDWMAMIGGVILFGVIGSYFIQLRNLPAAGWQWTILALASTWSADSGAYLTGKFLAGNILGRHALAPRLSPKKTVEGYVGGIVFSIIFTLIFAYFLDIAYLPAIVLSILAATLTPLGDLGISLLKRVAQVKDSGHLIPGHGGALDRVDTLLWAVAIAYYLVLLFY